ncbi:MAG: bifunctional phosphopantothenoylcysteine decarboxylase/phosphopantothenate--cysteine ligase CoaBC [Bacteroidales bacterium]|nr:bifunctional phosphopantothenoylcysteine decarboxylase/phosphopantothenate--cysteine ligase CoaBC [Bacteroidales bacterium]
MLRGKHILIGVTGSIAAYKAAMLVRLLVKEGAEVKVIMTEMAKKFITPLTMATLSGNPVLVEFYNSENGEWNSHVSLGIWTDLFIIAPASANTIAGMASGLGNNLLLTTYLSARSKVVVAPAMDLDMFSHPATPNNLKTLKERGVAIIEPSSGDLASGLSGKGRMEEPENILEFVKSFFPSGNSFKDKKVLITAGPTREPLDPVRFLSNYSTGMMGYSIAAEFASRGATVTIVSGPVSAELHNNSVSVISVTTAEEMYNATIEEYGKGADIAVFCAAVADFRPKRYMESKIKKDRSDYSLELIPNPDIAAELGKRKRDGTNLIGFALETDDEIGNALKKLKSKNLDAIVLNSLRDEGAGFGKGTNKIRIIERKGSLREYPVKDKREVANDIVDYAETLLSCSKL